MLETERIEVQEEAARILGSEPFRRAKRMSDLLRFVVNETVMGRAASLKESVLAVEVFGRPPSFDPKRDPVVRNEVRRLRAKLLEYYAGPAKGAGLVLEIPKGAYAPKLRKVSAANANRPGTMYSAAFGVVAALVVTSALVVATGIRRSERTSEFKVQPILTDPGVVWHPAISPDGNSIAFAWGATETSNAFIFIARIDGAQRRRLSASAGSQLSPTWSPDGKEIAFLRRGRGNQVMVVITALDGSSERVVANGAGFPNVAGTQLSWSPNGKWVAAALDGSITLLPASTGERRVFRFTAFSPATPRFSPDGRHIAMVGSVPGAPGHAIYRVQVSHDGVLQGDPVRVTHEGEIVHGGFDWTPDGTSFVFASGAPLDTKLWRTSMRDGKSEQLRLPGEEVIFPDISQGRLVFAKWNRDVDLWRIPLLGAGGAGEPQRLISSARPETDPQYSPNGEKLCFVSSRSGHPQIWIAGADGSAPVQITDMRSPLLDCPRWSPDGRSIVFQAMQDNRFQAFLVNVNSRELRQVTSNPKIGRAAPSFSHDGRLVYFTTARTGRNEIWKLPVHGGDAVQVTQGGGLRAWESNNGQRLFFEKESPRGLWEKSIASGEEKLILSSHPGDPVFTDAAIWFNTPRGISVLNKRRDGLQPLFVTPTSMQSVRHQMSISPDGQYVVFAQYTENRSELLLVNGFN